VEQDSNPCALAPNGVGTGGAKTVAAGGLSRLGSQLPPGEEKHPLSSRWAWDPCRREFPHVREAKGRRRGAKGAEPHGPEGAAAEAGGSPQRPVALQPFPNRWPTAGNLFGKTP
jgi:hypothetical protein